MKSLVILISGRGSNMRSIVEAARNESWPVRIAAVLSNRPEAEGLMWAEQQGIATCAIDHRNFPSREAFEVALYKAIDEYAPDAIALAGFMRVLTAGFVDRYEGRLVNIHPSLLPAFPGLHTHRQALAHGVKVHGCTVHFVTAQLDHGPIIAQAAVPVLDDDDESRLASRVLAEEHRIYPASLLTLLDGRLDVREGIVRTATGKT
jgi:phosphoribosylglycinamide formyltransferase 1